MSERENPLHQIRLANAVTYTSLFSLMLSIWIAMFAAEHHSVAVGLLLLSAIFDLFDGAFARRFPRSDIQKEVGIQLDSLCDVLAFGLTPIILIWSWASTLHDSLLVFAAAFFYVICAMSRLAFYNVVSSEKSEGFIGVPTTVMALLWGIFFLVLAPSVLATVLGLLVFSVLMVAPIRVPRPSKKALLGIAGLMGLISALHFVIGL